MINKIISRKRMSVPSAAVDIEVRQNMEVTPPQQERKR